MLCAFVNLGLWFGTGWILPLFRLCCPWCTLVMLHTLSVTVASVHRWLQSPMVHALRCVWISVLLVLYQAITDMQFALTVKLMYAPSPGREQFAGMVAENERIRDELCSRMGDDEPAVCVCMCLYLCLYVCEFADPRAWPVVLLRMTY